MGLIRVCKPAVSSAHRGWPVPQLFVRMDLRAVGRQVRRRLEATGLRSEAPVGLGTVSLVLKHQAISRDGIC